MATTNPNLPPLETQTSFLFREMNTGDGGNIGGTFRNNPGMSASDAAIAFEQQFEKSSGSNVPGRVKNANNVYAAYTNGNLTGLPANAQYVFNQAISRGYTPAQAAGIVGNLQAESGQSIDPYAYNAAGGGNGANGIAQWRAGRYRNLNAYDPATGEVVPNTEVQQGDINPTTGQPLTEEQAAEIREEATLANRNRRVGSYYSENPLNKYASYTYNWAVHIFHPEHAGKDINELISNNYLITLSQTGVENEISIDTVRQNMSLAFNEENRRSVANNFTISFLEPGGATFYTRIFEAARRLGIQNHLSACYVLELNLVGWDESATRSQTIGPYYYQTVLMSLDMDFRDGASFYTGNFIETADDAFSRNDFHLSTAISVSATTYGEFLSKFEEEINKQLQDQANAADDRLYPNEYHFGTTNEYNYWKDFGINQLSPSNAASTRGVSVNISAGTLTITIPKGTSVTAALSMVLYQTTEFKKLVISKGVYAKDSPESGTAEASKLAELVKWVSYNTDVKYLRFDPLLKNYVKSITYNVKGFATPEVVHDPVSYIELLEEKYQSQRLDKIFTEGFLKKRYDYINTGLNTEVLNLDITLRNAYFNVQAINHGYVNNASAVFFGLATEAEARIGQLKADRSALEQKIRESDKRITDLQTEQKRLGEAITGPGDSRLTDLSVNKKAIADENRQNASLRRSLPAVNNAINAAGNKLRETATNASTNLPSVQNRYITQSELLSSGMQFTEYMPNRFQYIEIQSLATANSPEDSNNIGQAMLGAVEVNLGKAYDLMEQVLTIRGDPYWLGTPKDTNAVTDTYANYDNGGVMYFLNAEFPTYPDESTGLPSNKRNFMISGLYRVFTVDVTYEAGLFTMTLNSARDTNTDSEKMYDSLIAGYALQSTSRTGPGVTNRDRQNQTDNNPDVTDPNNVGSDGATAGPVGNNTNSNNNLAPNINPDLKDILEGAAAASGVAVRTTSGVRAPGGSNRHAFGDASDTQLLVNGRVLSASNSADRAIIATFTQNYVALSRQAGYTPSVGWADTSAPSSQWYMGGNTGHYDIAVGNSVGANRGTYWGNGESSSGAPSWLRNIMTG